MSSFSERDREGGDEVRGLAAERLTFFSDAVTAITLLALDLPVPHGPTNGQFLSQAWDMRSEYLAFVISFAVIAAHWRSHHRIFRHVAAAVGTHLRWLTEHTHLYRYLVRYSMTGSAGDPTAFTDVKTAIGLQLTRLFTGYLGAFGLDIPAAEITAFGLVGYVESATTRWLDGPERVPVAELEEQLTGAIWTLLEHAVRSRGVALDPDRPLPPPGVLPGGRPRP